MKKINFNSLNYQTVISKIAKKVMKIHSFIKEWRYYIIIVAIITLITNIISLVAGFNFMYLQLISVVGNAIFTVVFSIIILIAMESLTMLSITKFFKFLFRNRYKTMILPLIASLFLYSVSFFVSTNGLAMRQGNEADNSSIINEKYEITKQQINDNYEHKIDDLKLFINTIKINPEGWSGGKRTILLKSQIKKIDSLYTVISSLQSAQKQEISDLKIEFKNDLKTNEILVTSEADKYFNFVAIVMIIQFVSKGVSILFYSIIYGKNEKETSLKEDLNSIIKPLDDNITTYFFNRIYSTANSLTSALEIHNSDTEIDLSQNANKELPNEKVANNKTEKSSKNKIEISGFGSHKASQKASHENQKNRSEHTGQLEDLNKSMATTLKYLNRHPKVVKYILKKTPELESISNVEINKIRENVGRVQKSRGLIQKIYTAIISVGYENILINNKGNIINKKITKNHGKEKKVFTTG